MAVSILEQIQPKKLHSNVIFDSVGIQIKKKPESSIKNSGGDKLDSVGESVVMEPDNPIIAEPPNSYKYKDYGVTTTTSRFIKFIPSDESDWLQKNHPNAFLLLCLIAKRARRFNGHIDGLEIGMAKIGDYWEAGIETEKKYRTAKLVLERVGAIKIIKTSRKCKNVATERATERAINGTLVIILKSNIWDINPEEDVDRKGDLKGDRRAIEGRSKGDEQERQEDKKSDLDLINQRSEDEKKSTDLKFKENVQTDKSSFEKIKNELLEEKWSEDEIYFSYTQFLKAKPTLKRSLKAYLITIMKNERNNKSCQTSLPNNLKSSLSNENICYTDPDTQNAPLAIFSRLNGLK